MLARESEMTISKPNNTRIQTAFKQDTHNKRHLKNTIHNKKRFRRKSSLNIPTGSLSLTTNKQQIRYNRNIFNNVKIKIFHRKQADTCICHSNT